MSVEFDTPANRIIAQQQPKNQFGINTSLPDIAFLRQLSVQGRLRYNSGSATGVADVLTITPNIGETIFIYRILFSQTGGTNTITDITNDGITRTSIGLATGGTFELNLFDSLVGDGIKQIEIANVSGGGTIRVTVLSWSENTSRIRDVTT